LGRAGVYDVDVPRIDRVVRRVIAGLLYGETAQALPPGYTPKVYQLSQIMTTNDTLGLIVGTVLPQAPLRFIGPRTVGYRILPSGDDPNASACLVTFYERVTWLGLTTAGRAAR